jgi:hypothetical protein
MNMRKMLLLLLQVRQCLLEIEAGCLPSALRPHHHVHDTGAAAH